MASVILIGAPIDGATGRSEFRRPSNVVRMFGQAYEWTGALNYTKALPQYQRDLSPANKFTYFFTNQLGGRFISGFNEEGLQVNMPA